MKFYSKRKRNERMLVIINPTAGKKKGIPQRFRYRLQWKNPELSRGRIDDLFTARS